MSSQCDALFDELSVYGRDGWSTAQYFVMLPSGKPKEPKGWPVLLFLQGTGEMKNMNWALRFDFFSAETRNNFIIVSPVAQDGQSPVLVQEKSSWGIHISRFNEEGVVHVLEHAIFGLKRDRGFGFVDEQRVYVTGYSLGGEATWNIGGGYGRFFAAISPIACCGHNDVICTGRGSLNLLHLPIRAFQSTTEKHSWKSNHLMKWLQTRLPVSDEEVVHHRIIASKEVDIVSYSPNRELWEIEMCKPEEYDPKNWRLNHDVWTTVYGNETEYGLLEWLQQFENPHVSLVNDLAFDFCLRKPLPRCLCPAYGGQCPSQRSGLWCGLPDSQDTVLVVGTFPEWNDASPFVAAVDELLLVGMLDAAPRVGDQIVSASGGSSLTLWAVAKEDTLQLPTLETVNGNSCDDVVRLTMRRPFGLSSSLNYCLAGACSQCFRVGLAGWESAWDGNKVGFCVECFASWDKSMRQNKADRLMRASHGLGYFTINDYSSKWEIVECTRCGDQSLRDDVCMECSVARAEWCKHEVRLHISCFRLLAIEFNRLYQAIMRRSRPISNLDNLAGEVLLWHHDGIRPNGTLELCHDSRVRWSGGAAHGCWFVEHGSLVVTFGYGAPMLHRLELVSGERLVLRQPMRSPASFADRPLVHLSAETKRRLEELDPQKDPIAALKAIQQIAERCLLGPEEIAKWRRQVLEYLDRQWYDGSYRFVSLPEVNRDLGFSKPSEVVTRAKLRELRSAVRLMQDKNGQLYVAKRSSLNLCAAAPRKCIMSCILSFVEPHLRSKYFGDAKLLCDQAQLRSATALNVSAVAPRPPRQAARLHFPRLWHGEDCAGATPTPNLAQGSYVGEKSNRWWECWKPVAVPDGHTSFSWRAASVPLASSS